MSANGSASEEHPFLEARHIDDLKGAVQALNRTTADLAMGQRDSLAAIRTLVTAVDRLADLLAGATQQPGMAPGGKKRR